MDEKGLYLAIHFPNDNPPGWYWGKPLPDTAARAPKASFKVNFTEEGLEYDPKDDVRVYLESLTANTYGTDWAVVARKDYQPPAAE